MTDTSSAGAPSEIGVSPDSGPTQRRKRGFADGDDSQESAHDRKKRAPTACRMCKSRKIKCSNEQPKCATCIRLQCECVYPQNFQRVFEDEPAQRILQTLEKILERLPDRHGTDPRPERAIASHNADPSHVVTASTTIAENDDNFLSIPTDPSERTGLDSMFKWPIFRYTAASDWPLHSPLFMGIRELEPDSLQEQSDAAGVLPFNNARGIIQLVQQFLTNVNTKNPIIDPQSLLNDARVILETGPMWDSRSCLVLLACALGTISKPFDRRQDTIGSSNSLGDEKDNRLRRHAEAFYHSARRRLGLLGVGLKACQCHFLSGIYNMYTMRPLQAWQSFAQASMAHIVYTRTPGRLNAEMTSSSGETTDPGLRSLEQRLFWSCLKSECEINLELFLPRSSLYTVDIPCMFPSPPALEALDTGVIPAPSQGMPNADASNLQQGRDISIHANQLELHQQSWFYYLTEISLLRLNNRIVKTFYDTEPAEWLERNVLDMCNETSDFEEKLQHWLQSLPEPIKFSDLSLDSEHWSELQYVTWGRYTKIRRLLYRPLFYRFIHASDEDPSLRQFIQPFAEKCVLACLDPAIHFGLRHRHHGTWFMCRETAVAALMLLAADRSGLIHALRRKEEVNNFLALFIHYLRYWEAESVDIRLARQIVEKIQQTQEQ